MKLKFWLQMILLFSLLPAFSSCEVVGGIFKTGMGVGIFISVIVIAIVMIFVSRAGKNK